MSTPVSQIKARMVLQLQLLGHEGFRSAAYQDSEGYWTIGIGRMIDSRKGGGITPEEALYLLANDIEKAERQLYQRLPWWRNLDEVRQRVLLDMAFNLGIDGLLEFKNTLQAIQEKRWEDAAKGMLASLWAEQVGARAHRLAQMMRTGEDVSR